MAIQERTADEEYTRRRAKLWRRMQLVALMVAIGAMVANHWLTGGLIFRDLTPGLRAADLFWPFSLASVGFGLLGRFETTTDTPVLSHIYATVIVVATIAAVFWSVSEREADGRREAALSHHCIIKNEPGHCSELLDAGFRPICVLDRPSSCSLQLLPYLTPEQRAAVERRWAANGAGAGR